MDDLGASFHENAGFGSNESAFKEFLKSMMGKDSNDTAGSAFQAILESSGLFREVNVRKVILPVSRCDEAQIGELYRQTFLRTGVFMCFWMDIVIRRIIEKFKNGMNQTLLAMEEKNEEDRLGSDVLKGVNKEINDPRRDIRVEVYMTWSRRRKC